MFIRSLFAICMLVPHLLLAEIFETNHFSTLLEHVDAETLVVFDVDDTMIHSTQDLGSVPWRHYIIKKAKQAGMNARDARQLRDKYWLFVQPLIETEAVDPEAPQILCALKEQKITSIGLTARTPAEASFTPNQLTMAQIELNPLWEASITFDSGALYREGVLYCDQKSKGESLKQFFEKTHYYPKKVVFIDDRMEHVKDLEKVMNGLKIPYVGLRFSGSDPYHAAFDPYVSDVQWVALPLAISNEDAANALYGQD